ncbi:MAG: hypothetical protein CMJ84_00615 [Planctomycetes bacterium]|nr:hypothetical protein [Planctomycetota bacterium]
MTPAAGDDARRESLGSEETRDLLKPVLKSGLADGGLVPLVVGGYSFLVELMPTMARVLVVRKGQVARALLVALEAYRRTERLPYRTDSLLGVATAMQRRNVLWRVDNMIGLVAAVSRNPKAFQMVVWPLFQRVEGEFLFDNRPLARYSQRFADLEKILLTCHDELVAAA